MGTQSSAYTNNRTNGMTYDAAGNQTNDGLHNYAFNAENQITAMDGGAAVYGYDGEGRRMKKTVGSETTYFFYGPGGLISEFSTTTGPTQAAATDKPNYRTSDKLGTAVLIIAASGTVIENNRTLPYGELWTSQVSSANNEKFTTYQRDQESGLDYAMARYYTGTSGRFVSVDIGVPLLHVPPTLNRYSYVANDPINHTDSDGNVLRCTGNLSERGWETGSCIDVPANPITPSSDPSEWLESYEEQQRQAWEQEDFRVALSNKDRAIGVLKERGNHKDCDKLLQNFGTDLASLIERLSGCPRISSHSGWA